jgi:hypothetical protein
MSTAALPRVSRLGGLAASDWLPAAFAVILYLQINNRLLERHLPGVPADALIAAALAVVVVLRWRSGGLAMINARRLALAALPWLVAEVVSGLDAAPREAWRREILLAWAWGLLAVLLAAMLDSRRAVSRAIYSLVGAGALIGALNCHQFLTSSFDRKYLGFSAARFQHLYDQVDGYRAVGPVTDPNYHAQFLLPLLILALERTWNARGRRRVAATAAATCLAGALALTYSRGALVVLAASLVPAIVAAVRWRVQALALALTLGVAAAAVAVAGAPLLARARTVLVTGVEQPLDEGAFSGRLSENLSALHMLRDHPWNGIGLGCYVYRYQEYASRLGMDPRPHRSAHNLYLEVAAETGTFGVIGLFTLIVSLFTIVGRSHRALLADGDLDGAHRAAAVAMALAAFLAAALFLHLSFQSMLWVLLAIGFATPQLRGSAP